MKKRNVFNKIFTAFWVLIVPYMLYEIVNQFVVIWQDFKEGDLNLGAMIIVWAVSYLFIWLAYLTGIFRYVKRGGSQGHKTIWDYILKPIIALIITPIVLTYRWVRIVIWLIVHYASLLFNRGASSGAESGNEYADNYSGGRKSDGRKEGTDRAICAYINNKLPKNPYWHHGYSKAVVHTEMSPTSNTILIGADVTLSYENTSRLVNESEVRSDVRSALESYAQTLLNAAASAFEECRGRYSGYDDNFNIKIDRIVPHIQ